MSDRPHGWLTAETPKPRPVHLGALGQDALDSKGRAKRIPRAELSKGLEDGRHARCIDHVSAGGLSEPVCVLPGQDPAAVAAEARELSGT